MKEEYYRKKEENNEFCKHCLYVLMRRTQKTLARCPNCAENHIIETEIDTQTKNSYLFLFII